MAAVKKVFSKIQQIVQVITKYNMLMLLRTTIFSKNLRSESTWLQEVIMISVSWGDSNTPRAWSALENP